VLGVINQLKSKIFEKREERGNKEGQPSCDEYLISLGVLLWAVAEADESFMPVEKQAIKNVLKSCGNVQDKDLEIVLRAIEESALARIDLHAFTKEISEQLSFPERLNIVENLFRVACVDKALDNEELEMIRKISNLIKVDHPEFIEAKLKIKKEFGLAH